MNAADVLMRAHALVECTDPTAPGAGAVRSVTAVHDAVVVEIDCADHESPHTVIVCGDCGMCDGRVIDDEDCPVVAEVIAALGLGDLP